MNQDDYMSAVTGDDKSIYRTCKALFPCGTQYGEEIGTASMTGNLDAARKALADAGYKGEKVLILNPADVPTIAPFGRITFDYLKALGMNATIEEMDWNTLAVWRAKTDPIDKGGWSIFHNWWLGTSIANPAISTVVRGLGAKGWAGSFASPKIEDLTAQWTVAPTDDQRAALARAIHAEAMDAVPTVILGRFFILSAHRKGLTGLLEGTSPFPWNLRWA
jgi:peptide/nickel transport system substrate-binding protein